MNPQSLADKLDKKVCDLWLVANNYREGTPGWNTYNDLIKLLTEAAAEVRGGGWQDMATAPKGGGAERTDDPKWVEPPDILLAFPGGEIAAGHWEWYYAEGGNGYVEGLDAWCESVSSEQLCLTYGTPVAWQPLPSPPGAVGEG